CGPLDRIAKQFEVVDVEHFPKSTVDIPGEVNNTTSRREIAEIDFCDIDPGLTGKHFLHRQVGVAGNQRQPHFEKPLSRFDLDLEYSIYNPRSIFYTPK